MKTSEVIRAAMRHAEKGWTKGRLRDDYGNVCALGAVTLAANGVIKQVESSAPFNLLSAEFRSPEALQAYSAAATALEGKVMELGWSHVPGMNDDPNTTKQDVLNVMEKTALSLEEHGE